MKTLSDGLAVHLAAGATTLCHCWRIERRDGAVLGFTDHDRALAFEGVTYQAISGLEASEAVSALGLGVDNLEVAGALSAVQVSEADILAGRYDDAGVEMFAVNWQAPEQRVLLSVARIGEIRRRGAAFVAELRGLSQQLAERRGRLFSNLCDAELGDARCRVDLDLPAFRGTGMVIAAADERSFTAEGLAGFEDGWFRGGALEWTSGNNAGVLAVVKSHGAGGQEAGLELRDSAVAPISPGDQFVVRAGCDKAFETCRNRFQNSDNFRGFPHMPGSDFALSYPSRDDGRNRGRSLVR